MSKESKHEPLIFDSHLDISMNAMEWNRDQRWTVDRGRNTVSFPALREGKVGLVVATQIGRVVKPGAPIPGWYSQEQAWAHTQGQLQWYRCMEEAGEMKQIIDSLTLDESLALWEDSAQDTPICYLLSLEGADSLISMKHLAKAYAQGLRAIGPAHYGPGVYANGTDATGRLNGKGVELLKTMEELHMILDTIADLQKLPGLLEARGYQKEDVLNILHGNFIRYLRNYFNKD